MVDAEKGRDPATFGLPALATFIARDPDHETYVFRKFKKLTARTLLHLQSELINLEAQLNAIDRKAQEGSDPVLALSLRHWEILRARAAEREGDERKIIELTAEIEDKLLRYQRALRETAEIAKMHSPGKRVLEAYRHEFNQMDIRGHSADMLTYETDLVALKPSADKDLLSNFIREHWPGPTNNLSASGQSRTEHFKDHWSSTTGSICSVIVAAGLLMGSILGLYFERRPNYRLGLLMMFIALFAIGIRVCTSASRDNIFAATAAYSAVLVVFVSGNLANAT